MRLSSNEPNIQQIKKDGQKHWRQVLAELTLEDWLMIWQFQLEKERAKANTNEM